MSEAVKISEKQIQLNEKNITSNTTKAIQSSAYRESVFSQSKQKVRLDPLGNSGKEFATYEEAYEWGYSQMAIRQMGYVVGRVMYSDGTVTYSVDFRK